MVLNLVEPQSSGIGGGGFILYYDAKTRNIYAWDGREKAPMNFSERVFLNSDGKKKGFIEAVSGGLAVGVPSLVTMLEKAHEVHGNMQWKLLFEDSIKLSTEGFVVGKRLSKHEQQPVKTIFQFIWSTGNWVFENAAKEYALVSNQRAS